MIIYLPLLIALIGLIVYLTATTNGKLTEIGRILFWVGLLAFLLHAPQLTTTVLR